MTLRAEMERLCHEGELDLALTIGKQALCGQPEDARVCQTLAGICEQLGRESEAESYYRQAIAIGLPREEWRAAQLALGCVLRQLGRFPESRRVLEAGMKRFPEAREFALFLAISELEAQLPGPAIRRLLTLLGQTSADPALASHCRSLGQQIN
ncbi:tetratricopeptide repeat protein [Aeromonas schubertii]|uniref:Tetratricopeptide repeat protein n=1 Tax=Aeromonas schubertii TaxID=652 RepID=A0ABS7VCK4_9GAMM|nr:tetratricopeptide repeat protein [Aeromonas schubertii]KUE80641.1 hypothetical protein ATO46_15400 [Aeromonas schubertii]MBZ6067112.1 tetratricopeptide repeat protein [Aeromonas schubertii]QCG49410.1 tetratricopeptide repeat protein [Aeromonas schubertii]